MHCAAVKHSGRTGLKTQKITDHILFIDPERMLRTDYSGQTMLVMHLAHQGTGIVDACLVFISV